MSPIDQRGGVNDQVYAFEGTAQLGIGADVAFHVIDCGGVQPGIGAAIVDPNLRRYGNLRPRPSPELPKDRLAEVDRASTATIDHAVAQANAIVDRLTWRAIYLIGALVLGLVMYRVVAVKLILPPAAR